MFRGGLVFRGQPDHVHRHDVDMWQHLWSLFHGHCCAVGCRVFCGFRCVSFVCTAMCVDQGQRWSRRMRGIHTRCVWMHCGQCAAVVVRCACAWSRCMHVWRGWEECVRCECELSAIIVWKNVTHACSSTIRKTWSSASLCSTPCSPIVFIYPLHQNSVLQLHKKKKCRARDQQCVVINASSKHHTTSQTVLHHSMHAIRNHSACAAAHSTRPGNWPGSPYKEYTNKKGVGDYWKTQRGGGYWKIKGK